MKKSSETKFLPEAVFERMADAIRLLGNVQRLKIIEFLDIKGESCVGEIVDGVGGLQGAVSQHLIQMRTAGMVASRREGRQVFYRMASKSPVTILNCIRRQME